MATSTKPKVIWKGASVMASLRGTSLQNLSEASIFLKDAVQETLTGNRSGRVYRVPATKQKYTASAPGEPPAVRLGDLKRAISHKVNKAKLTAIVGPRLIGQDPKKQYPVWLEFGTKKMSPRPYMKPTFDKSKDTVIQIMKEGWNS